MLDSIYKLAQAHVKSDSGDDLSSLLTPVNVKHVIGIVFKNNNGSISYSKSQLYEFDRPSFYLFKKDPSGRPGLFLTGSISRQDIEKLHELSKDQSKQHLVQKFAKLKILWFPRGKLVNDKHLLETLESDRKEEISKILEEFEDESKKISHDVVDLLLKDAAERTLVTIMIHDSNNKNPLFVGQMKDYKEFFMRGTLAKRPDSVGLAICSVCNNEKSIGIFRERPLPFFFADKPMFFPDANPSYGRKGFPVCDSCYLVLQHGTQFIADKLNYSILAVGSGRSDLKFWLIPHLNDQELMINFKDDLDNANLYLNSLSLRTA